jgi:hypothetical protein
MYIHTTSNTTDTECNMKTACVFDLRNDGLSLSVSWEGAPPFIKQAAGGAPAAAACLNIVVELCLRAPLTTPHLSIPHQINPCSVAVATDVVLGVTLGTGSAPEAAGPAIPAATLPALSHVLLKLIATCATPPGF